MSTCPFANREGKLNLSELPSLTADTIRGLSGHSDKVKLVIFSGYLFDVTSDSSFEYAPLAACLYNDATEEILKLQFKAEKARNESKSCKEAAEANLQGVNSEHSVCYRKEGGGGVEGKETTNSNSDKDEVTDDESEFAKIDAFSKMQMKSNLLRLFCDKYKTIAKVTS